ncbi:MAG TPA: SurA N-terminal domain-containing protein, partial [Chthonomonadaceae bacterium]|nr:SurA N-terminal domain-containing protein [Chthonomonadaceae bacterium]
MNFLSISWWRNISQKMGRSVGWGCLVIFGVPLVIGFSWWGSNQNRGANATQANDSGDVLTVNGEPVTQKEFLFAESHGQMPQPGISYARAQGQIIYLLIMQRLIAQKAKALQSLPPDADVDREVAQQRESILGAKATESDWENYLDQRHLTPEEFRQQIQIGLMGKALEDRYQKQEKVTSDEAKNQSSEVELNLVMIPILNPSFPTNPKAKPQPLPDADAKKKAEDLLAQVRAGSDIVKIAKENSGDGNAQKGGDTGWVKEYGDSPLSYYGKEFQDSAHQAQKGQFTPVVKVAGFQPGYVFARVTDRRNNLPKDFDEKKVIEQLQTQRSQEKLSKELDASYKAAKIQFGKGQEDKKAYYDYFRSSLLQMQQMQAMMGQSTGDEPSAQEVSAQKALADTELEGVYQRHAKDGSSDGATAAIMIAQDLQQKLGVATPADQPQIRDRLITLYETALKTTEDRKMRFDLANLYREKKDFDNAEAQLNKIASQLREFPPFDLASMQDAMSAHAQLVTAYKQLDTPIAPRPSAAAAAQKEQDAMIALRP